MEADAIYPIQCPCGHIYLEKYQFTGVTDAGYIGFCWCGFCRRKLMVKPYNQAVHADQKDPVLSMRKSQKKEDNNG